MCVTEKEEDNWAFIQPASCHLHPRQSRPASETCWRKQNRPG